ncbi:MAG: T9SS type A sorting domain-containing protein [Paludibacter sp.]
MKRIIGLFSFLLVVLICTDAQKYVPFPTENAQWNIYYASSIYDAPWVTTRLQYSLIGDTIINGINYRKMCRNIGTTENPIFKSVGGLREQDKKIFYTGNGYSSYNYPTINTERLLYDFNKKVGDVVAIDQWRGYPITKIDSVKIGNEYRKRYNDCIIEGIGDVVGGLFAMITDLPTCSMCHYEWHFICFSQNGENLLLNPDYESCTSIRRWIDSDNLKTGTQWYYGEKNYISIDKPDLFFYNYNSVKSVGDTIINAVKCYKINRVRGYPMCYSGVRSMYMYQSNDTTYFYNSVKNKFCPLYNFRAIKGDSWTVEFPFGNIVTTVDSLTAILTSTKAFIVQHVTYSSNNENTDVLHSKIIQNIGDINNLFMFGRYFSPSCDEMYVEHTGLRCYVHPDFGTFHVPGTLDCTYVTEVPKQNYSTLKVSLNSLGILSIDGDLSTEPCTLELIDLKGSVMLKITVNASKNTVNLNQYDKGLYLYRISGKEGLLKAGKIVKN